MFNKLKQFKDLRQQAKTMQSVLEKESVTEERNGIKVVMNGNMEITELTITNEESATEIARLTKGVVNDAIKKVQRLMAKKMQEMGGIPGMN
ncbi:YbaB/EbfC family DNA-binding protein [Candidatus Falkowbacteria bacterium]|jgi:DNA-binding protein YbaB|nr:YbaB/EbfC family nucleoid-associated protein [Patescibacteria group bacterium]MDD3435085.1 YbaB/EbfC family nucleoid-associated protein [Patescibacteria group bacterium]MDD4466519.1 YbaB/EbfC family nucleoid-associated protein [Patescibacteria group bacterium]NCU43174.1 YbaB/EbfC family DNA-binding protein [Candidatus Falkowbacteria bacterium]